MAMYPLSCAEGPMVSLRVVGVERTILLAENEGHDLHWRGELVQVLLSAVLFNRSGGEVPEKLRELYYDAPYFPLLCHFLKS